MAEMLQQVETIHPDSGHIGMMAGRNAEQKVWQPVLDWLQKNS